MFKNAASSSASSSVGYKHLKHKNLHSDLSSTCISSSITIDFTEHSESQLPLTTKTNLNEGERSAGYSLDESVFNYSFGTTEGSCENIGRPVRALSTCSNTETVECYNGCHHSQQSDSATCLEIAGKKITYCSYEHVITYTPESLLKRYQEICALTNLCQTPAKIGVSFLDSKNDLKCRSNNESERCSSERNFNKDSGSKSRTTRVFRNFLALVSPRAQRRSRSKDMLSLGGNKSQPRSKSAAAESWKEKRHERNEMSKKKKVPTATLR